MKQVYSVWDEMRRMQEQMDSLFGSFFGRDSFFDQSPLLVEGPVASDKSLVSSAYRQPVSDIYETEKEIIAEVELPGMDKKDIKVNITKDGIDIKAELKSENKYADKKSGLYRFERKYSGFSRYFALPTDVDADKAVAKYENGVLKITVPKLAIEHQKKKLLEIE